jgi:hypothetical protein
VDKNQNLIVGAKNSLIRSGLNKGVQEYFLEFFPGPRTQKSKIFLILGHIAVYLATFDISEKFHGPTNEKKLKASEP